MTNNNSNNNSIEDAEFSLSFFSKNKKSINIAAEFINYFQETVWLLIQQFFTQLCLELEPEKKDQIEQAVAIQKRALQNGKQVHLGEILMQTYALEAPQIHRLLEKMKHQFLYCKECNSYFQVYNATANINYSCPNCKKKMDKICPKQKLIVQGLRTQFCMPLPLTEVTCEEHRNFSFLDAVEYSSKPCWYLEQEIFFILQSLQEWINTPTIKNPPEKKFGSFFFCYIQNLHEIFWLASQKFFTEIVCSIYSLKADQIDMSLEIQQRAFQKNKQYHIGESLLQTYQLNQKQVCNVLSRLEQEIFICGKCSQPFIKIFPSKKQQKLCPICRNSLSKFIPKDDMLLQALRINIFCPVPIPDTPLIEHKLFDFFKPRKNYTPKFNLERDELIASLTSFFDSIGETASKKQLNIPSFKGKNLEFDIAKTQQFVSPAPARSKTKVRQTEEIERVIDEVYSNHLQEVDHVQNLDNKDIDLSSALSLTDEELDSIMNSKSLFGDQENDFEDIEKAKTERITNKLKEEVEAVPLDYMESESLTETVERKVPILNGRFDDELFFNDEEDEFNTPDVEAVPLNDMESYSLEETVEKKVPILNAPLDDNELIFSDEANEPHIAAVPFNDMEFQSLAETVERKKPNFDNPLDDEELIFDEIVEEKGMFNEGDMPVDEDISLALEDEDLAEDQDYSKDEQLYTHFINDREEIKKSHQKEKDEQIVDKEKKTSLLNKLKNAWTKK